MKKPFAFQAAGPLARARGIGKREAQRRAKRRVGERREELCDRFEVDRAGEVGEPECQRHVLLGNPQRRHRIRPRRPFRSCDVGSDPLDTRFRRVGDNRRKPRIRPSLQGRGDRGSRRGRCRGRQPRCHRP